MIDGSVHEETTTAASSLSAELGSTQRSEPGAAIGTLRISSDAHPTKIRAFAWSPERYEEVDDVGLDALDAWTDLDVVWLDVVGLGTVDAIKAVARHAHLHALALEDVVHTHQRPKLERYSDGLFVVLRMLRREPSFESEQFSLYVKPGLVVTFQETSQDCLGLVRERIRKGGRLRRHATSSFAAYAIIDAIVDSGFPILEAVGNELEELELETLEVPHPSTLARIHRIRRELMLVRRAYWPQREVVQSLSRSEDELLDSDTLLHLRDTYDHTVQIIDLVESYREVCSGLGDLYVSLISHRMNEIMKVLTIIATIFIPLTFIAGLYGMNFDSSKSPWNMPELAAYWGYPICLGVMGVVALCMLWWFRRKRWIGA